MGLFTRKDKSVVTAQYQPPVMGDYYGTNFNGFFGTGFGGSILRSEAMSVPAMARARGLICGIIGTIPLELFDKKTGAKIETPPPWVDQLDYRQPRSVTISWLVDSLLFYPQAYLEVMSEYADGRPQNMAWVSNDRVSQQVNKTSTIVLSYLVDGYPRPTSGVSSIVTIQSIAGDGLLTNGVQILRGAIDVQNAATIAAQTPQATGHLKNSGADLSPDKVQGLKDTWRSNRKSGATSYLTSTIDFIPNSYSPKDMLYNEAIQYFATQISRLCNLAAFWLDADADASSNTYQNRVDVRQDLVDMSLRPFLASIEDRLSMDDICPRGQVVRFALDATFLKNDPMTRLTVIEKMLSLGLIDVPEAQKLEGLAESGNNTPRLVKSDNITQLPKAIGDGNNG